MQCRVKGRWCVLPSAPPGCYSPRRRRESGKLKLTCLLGEEQAAPGVDEKALVTIRAPTSLADQ